MSSATPKAETQSGLTRDHRPIANRERIGVVESPHIERRTLAPDDTAGPFPLVSWRRLGHGPCRASAMLSLPRFVQSLGLLVLVACSGRPRIAAAVARPTVAGEARLNVVDAGATPRRALRYQFTAHSMVEIQSRWLSTSKRRDTEGPAPYVEVKAIERVRFASVAPDGSARFDFEIVNGSVESRDLDGHETRAGIESLRGSGVLDSRGVVRALTGANGRSIQPHVESLISDCLVDELPAEPVGVGARWQSGKYADWLVTLIYVRPRRVYLGYATMDNAPFEYPQLPRRDPRPLRLGLAEPEGAPNGASGAATTLIDLSSVASLRMLAVDERFDDGPVSHRVSRTDCAGTPIEPASNDVLAANAMR